MSLLRNPMDGSFVVAQCPRRELDSRELGFAATIVDFNDGYRADIRAKG